MEAGHTSEQVYGGDEALACFKNNAYDLIMMDVMLPGTDGFELIRLVDQDTPVIFLTAMGQLSDNCKETAP